MNSKNLNTILLIYNFKKGIKNVKIKNKIEDLDIMC